MAEFEKSKKSEDDTFALTCTICLELFEDPRVLPCLHTFCCGCLERLLKDAEEETKMIKCPQCRGTSPQPDNGIDGLTKNVLIIPELIKAKANRKAEKLVCESCTSKDVAVRYCEVCADYLCQSCTDSHKKMKVLQNHSLQPLGGNTEDCLLTQAMKVATQCPKHLGQEMALFCTACEIPICYKCYAYDGHSKHHLGGTIGGGFGSSTECSENPCEISTAVTRLLPGLMSSATEAQMQLKNITELLKFLDNVETEKEKRKDSIECKVNRHYDELLKKIELERKKALEKVEESSSTFTKQLLSERERTDIANREVQSCLRFQKKFTEQIKSYPQVIVLYSTLQNCLRKLASVKKTDSQVISSLMSGLHSFSGCSEFTSNENDGHVCINEVVPDEKKAPYTVTVEVVSHLPSWFPVEVTNISVSHLQRHYRETSFQSLDSSFKCVNTKDEKEVQTQKFEVTMQSLCASRPIISVSLKAFLGYVPMVKKMNVWHAI